MAQLGLHRLVAEAGYPSTSAISAWQSIGTLLLAKCARRHRAHHIDALTDDAGLAFGLRLTALPKATHAGSYSYRVRRESNTQLLTGMVKALRPLGLASGTEGFNLDFHAIRHHGEHTVLEKHYVPRRSQRTRACSLSSPRTTPAPRWSTPTPKSPRPSRPAKSSPSPTTGATPPAKTPGYWCSTPN